MTCVECGRYIRPGEGYQIDGDVFCSKGCGFKYYLRLNPPSIRICEECGRQIPDGAKYFSHPASSNVFFCSDGCYSKYYGRHADELERLDKEKELREQRALERALEQIEKEEQRRIDEEKQKIQDLLIKLRREIYQSRSVGVPPLFFYNIESDLKDYITIRKSQYFDLTDVEKSIKSVLNKEVSAFVKSVKEGCAYENYFPFWEKVCDSLAASGFNVSEEKKLLSGSKHLEAEVKEKENKLKRAENERRQKRLRRDARRDSIQNVLLVLIPLFMLASLIHPIFYLSGFGEIALYLVLLVLTIVVSIFWKFWGIIPLFFYLCGLSGIGPVENMWLRIIILFIPQVISCLLAVWIINRD